MQLRKHLSALMLASLLFAQIQLGNIKGFEPLIQKTSAVAPTFTFPTAWDIRSFVNSIPGITPIPVDPESGAAKFDDATATRICQLKGYRTVQNKTPDFYRSCGDNWIWYADGGHPNGVVINACQFDLYIWTLTCANPLTQCSDGIDNDGDGKIDAADPQCHTDGNAGNAGSYDATRDNEAGTGATCSDGIDNDGDGKIDGADPDCHTDHNAGNPASYNPNGNEQPTQCSDGIDNDHDGAIDAADASCHTDLNADNPASYDPNRNDEANPKTACQDGIDNDGDGQIDMQDPGCSSPQDNDEGPRNPPNMTVTKSGPSTVTPGQNVTYTFTITNGPVPINGVAVIDNFPSNLTFVSGTGNCRENPQTPIADVVCGEDNYAPNQTRTYSVTFKVSQNAQCNSSMSNTADLVLVSQGWSFKSSNPVTATVQCQQPVMQIVKSGPATATQGGIMTYTIRSTNTSNFPAFVAVTDDLPAGLTFVSGSDDCRANPQIQGPNFVCGHYNYAPGETKTYTVQVRVPPTAQCSSAIDNVANASWNGQGIATSNHAVTTVQCAAQCSDGQDNDHDGLIDKADPDCHTDGDARNNASYDPNRPENGTMGLPQCQDGIDNDNDGLIDYPLDPGCTGPTDNDESPRNAPNMTITKTGPATATIGQTVTYTFTARNNGTTNAHNIAVIDNHVPNFTFVSGTAGCGDNPQSPLPDVVCGPFDYAPGQSRTFSVTFNVSANTSCNLDASDTADLVLVDQGWSFLSSQSVHTTLQCATQCSDGQDNDHDGFIDAQDPACHTDGNPANAASYTPQHNSESDGPADIQVVSMNGPATVPGNGNATYTVVIKNSGPDAATTPFTLRDPIPAGFVFVPGSSSQNCAQNGNDVICSGLTLGVNQQLTLTITFNAPVPVAAAKTFWQRLFGVDSALAATCGNSYPNQVFLNPSQPDPNTGNNQSSVVTTTVTCQQPLQFTVSKLATTQVGPGELLTYIISATNNGNSAQNNIRIADLIPPGLTFSPTGSTFGCSQNGTSIFCTPQTFNPGQTVSYTLKFTANPNNACNSVFNNTASIQQNNATFGQSNTTATTFLCTTPKLDISKSAPPISNAGGTVTYTYTLKNTSATQTAIDVHTYDFNINPAAAHIPSQFTFASSSLGGACAYNATADQVICTIGNMAPNQLITYTLTFNVPNNQQLCGQTVINQVDAWPGTDQANADWDKAQTSVQCQPQTTDVSIVKTAPASLPNDNAAPYTYTLTVRNNTANPAQNVVVTDAVPAGLMLVSATAGCINNGNAVTCSLGTLGPNAVVTLTIGVSAPARSYCAQTVTNTANVTTSTTDTNSQNNQSSTQTAFTCSMQHAKLYITKDVPATTVAGQNVTYNFTLQNTSAFAANGINVYDYYIDQNTNQIPLQFTFVSSTGINCHLDQANNRITCDPVNLTAGQMISFTMTFSTPNTPQSCNQAFTNRADSIVGTDQQTLDSDVATTTLTCTPPRFTVTKLGPTEVQANEVLTYLISATNTGNTPQQNIRIADLIPAGLTFTTNGSTPGCTQNGTSIFCTPQTFQPGQTISYTLKFTANPNNACNSVIDNVAAIQQNSVTFGQSNHTQTTFFCTTPKLDISKSAPPISNAGGTVTYTYTLKNTNATQTALDVHTYDFNIDPIATHIPSQFTFVSSSLGGACAYNATADQVICAIGNMAPNQLITYTLTFSVPNNQALCGQTVINQVDAWPGTDQANADWDKAQTMVQCQPQNTDVSVTKTGPATLSNDAASPYSYTIIVKNNTAVPAANVVVTDNVPAGLTFVSASAPCTNVGNAVTCNLGTLGANATVTLNIAVSAPARSYCAQTIANTAYVTTSTTDTNPNNNQSTTQTSFTCTPLTTDISIAKTAPATLSNDSTTFYTYTLTVTNNTANPAANVIVTDAVPAGLTLLSASSPCISNGNAVSCSLGTLGANATVMLSIAVSAPARSYCSQSVANTANVTTTTQDTNMNNNQSTALTAFTCTPLSTDISIAKTAPATLQNDAVTPYSYTIIVKNNTAVPAANVVVTDNVPAGLTFVSASAPCTNVGNAVTCNLGTLGANAVTTINIAVSAPARSYCSQSVSNVATVTTTTADTNLQNNASSTQTAFTCSVQHAKLYITKDVAPTTVAGQTVTYFYTLQNTSAFTASGVNVFDTFIDQNQNPIALPFTFVSSNGISCHLDQANNRIACNPVSLTAGQMISFTMTFQTPSAAQVCNQAFTNRGQAIVGTDQQTIDNDTATTTLTCPAPQFTIVKYADVQTIQPGGTITYTIVAANAGTQSQTLIRIADAIPANLTFIPTGSTAGCTVQGTAVFCPSQTFTSGQTVTTILKFQLSQSAPCTNASVDNVASVQQNSVSFLSSNHVLTPITCPNAPQFTLNKIGPTVVMPGELMTYIITATNIGPTAQSNIRLVDDIPTGITFTPTGSTAGCVQNGAEIDCPAQTFQPGQSITYTLKFTANQNMSCTSQIVNEAELQQNTTAFVYSNQWKTDAVCNTPKLDITKSAPATSNAGGTVTYTFTLRNTSTTDTAFDVNTYDFFIDNQANHIPSPFTFLTSSLPGNPCSYDPQMDRTTCHIGNMAPQQFLTYTLTYSVPNTQSLCNQSVINQVDAWPGSDQAHADWDKAQTTVQCAPQGADLSILKTGPASVTKGGNVVYTVTVNNLGPATATSVVTHDQIPQGMTFVSASGPATCVLANNNTEVACTIGSVTTGAPVAIQLTFATQAAGQNCTASTATNVVTVTSATTDPNMGNNQSQAQTQLTCPQPSTADLSIVKTGPATVIRGNTVTYSIIVSNSGPASASGVTVTDVLPAGLQNIQVTGGSCAVTGNGSQASCTIGTLASGASVTITVTALVPIIQACTPTAITNSASVSATTTDPNMGNNQSVAVTAVNCPADTNADVGVLKFGGATVVRGGNVTYSIIATNYGPGTAQNVVISDPLPQGLTFVSASGVPCIVQNGNVTCTIATLPSGQSTPVITVTYAAPVIQNCTPTTVTNTATVATTTTDPNAANNQSQVQTAVTCQAPNQADLFVNKTGPQTVQYGSNVTYTITATNAGPASVSGVTVIDNNPAALTYVSSSGSVTCSLVNNASVSCAVGALVSGASKTFTLTFSTVSPQTCTQATVTNLASISENDPNVTDPNAANNQAQATTTLTCANVNADVAVTKTGPSSATRGGTLTYTLTAVNNGPASATNVVLHDPFSAELTYASATGATCSVVGSEVQCALGTMTSGQTVTVALTFNVKTVTGTCSQTSIQNTATVTTGSTDPVSANNTSQTITTALTCNNGSINDITVFKTDNRTTANVGESLRYSIVLTNSSNKVVNSLLVTDPVPYGLTIATVSDGGTISGQQVRWTDISVPANSSRTLYIDVQVSSSLSNNTLLTNTVDVNGKQATDQTTIYNNNNSNPPPPYYPPYTPPPYYPPVYNNPPPYYNPPTVNPPVYYPTQPPPPVIYPQTGTKDGRLYAKPTDTASLTKVQTPGTADDNGFSAVFYATMLAIFAAGSAVASRFAAGGL